MKRPLPPPGTRLYIDNIGYGDSAMRIAVNAATEEWVRTAYCTHEEMGQQIEANGYVWIANPRFTNIPGYVR